MAGESSHNIIYFQTSARLEKVPSMMAYARRRVPRVL
ncbi:uncharacterized protein G2W53_027265 [Senna tora]|uniref:Uncharacterized protein n=1 Tax=Senna tora TaxID=362788 RepID=A0A834WFX0_9FABA|nr:uncharacterized protein G2W53_027265 [Senna tora]